MQKDLRKNINLLDNEDGIKAYEFLSKCERHQSIFITRLVCDFLDKNGIKSIQNIKLMEKNRAKELVKTGKYESSYSLQDVINEYQKIINKKDAEINALRNNRSNENSPEEDKSDTIYVNSDEIIEENQDDSDVLDALNLFGS